MPVNQILRQRSQALASFLNTHRILLYTLTSTIAVAAVITNALKNHSNFYSVAIYLSKSSRSVLVLANFGFLLALLCGHIVQKIFFGSLRPSEVERLYDRLWFFITESLLAFTIFRDEFDTSFALMFGFLLFVKSFHWLAGDRIEWMDQRPYPGPSVLFHIRMTVLFGMLWATDCIMFLFAAEHTISVGVGGMVLFASEYGILMASVMNIILKYLLSAYDLRRAGRRGGENAPPWENKSMWIFYIELATDFLKLTTYLIFFTIIITFYGLPLNIIRDVYITARSFVTRLRALHRYQTATRNMDQRYPNATEEELGAMSDHTCIICREEMIFQATPQVNSDGPNTTPKKLPCGHIFHFYCLRSWLERQQSCPTCRRTVLETPGAPRAADIPAAPVAAAAPQQANNRGFQILNPQDANNPLGNPLGFVGRLFGPPAQAPGPFPPNQNNNAQNPAIIAGQGPQGILIQYQIQYQLPRHNPTQEHAQRVQQLQPVPRFPGFPGPGGGWQRWPPEAQPPPASESNSTVSADSETPQNGNPVPTPTTSNVGASSNSSASPTSASTPSEPGTPETAREAAAFAALRRLGGNTLDAARVRLPFQRPVMVNTPQSTTSASNAPKLIPLYDFNSQGSPQYHSPIAANSSAGHRESPLRGVAPENGHILPRLHPGQSLQQDPRVSSLPPSLTEQQLQRMDRLTREAIDERLKVLEGVSGTLYRCIDDLMRMRSVLPPPTPAGPSTHNDLSKLPSDSEKSEGDDSSAIDSRSEPSDIPNSSSSG